MRCYHIKQINIIAFKIFKDNISSWSRNLNCSLQVQTTFFSKGSQTDQMHLIAFTPLIDSSWFLYIGEGTKRLLIDSSIEGRPHFLRSIFPISILNLCHVKIDGSLKRKLGLSQTRFFDTRSASLISLLPSLLLLSETLASKRVNRGHRLTLFPHFCLTPSFEMSVKWLFTNKYSG